MNIIFIKVLYGGEGLSLRKMLKRIGWIVAIIMLFVTATMIVEKYSLVSKNTRNLEVILSKNISSNEDSTNGNVKDLTTFDYDKMYVFEPYQSLEEMEKQIGFKYSKLKQGLSEGMINILFVKDNRTVAYLFGYSSTTGYFIEIPSGEYTKSQINKMTYTAEKREVGNFNGIPKTYMSYQFID